MRGAIDLALVAAQLATIRDVALPEDYTAVVLDAVLLALSGRIFLDETLEATPEAVLRRIWEDHFLLLPAAADPG